MSLQLVPRTGPRPTTHFGIPHRQLDQIPPLELYQALVERFVAMPNTVHGDSLISVPGAIALFVPEEVECNLQGCMRGREFAHVHPAEDGSFHMIFSDADCERVLESGWGELHPWAKLGKAPRTLVMVYAPRDADEVEIVLEIAAAAYRNAVGEPGK